MTKATYLVTAYNMQAKNNNHYKGMSMYVFDNQEEAMATFDLLTGIPRTRKVQVHRRNEAGISDLICNFTDINAEWHAEEN